MAKKKTTNKLKEMLNNFKKAKFKDKRIIILTLISIAVLLLLVSTSFAMFFSSASSDSKDLYQSGDLVVTFDDTAGNAINLNPTQPVSDEYGTSLEPYTFTIQNTGTLNATYKVMLTDEIITNTAGLTNAEVKSNIKYQTDTTVPKLLSSLQDNVLFTGTILPGESLTFSLRLWMKEEATTNVEKSTYSAKLAVTGKALRDESKTANAPDLASGMIPVVYDDENDVWIKANTSEEWYNYDKQMWANAVTVDSCIPKGDINLDGSITQEDAQLVLSYSAQNVVDYTEEEMLLRGDINGDGKIQFRDATMILNVASDPDKYKLTYNLCTSPAKDPSVSKARADYESAEAGTVIAMEDINAMWVWIPRYKYKITSGLGSSSPLTNPPQIDVVFENGTNTTGVDEATYRTGITSTGTNTNYYTHPAFRNIDNITYDSSTTSRGAWKEEITGFWVGKFETGGTTEAPLIKPNISSLLDQDVSTLFLTSLKFAGGTMNTASGNVTFIGNDRYGLVSATNTHMMKNTEWGAVAILSQSKYGKMGNNNYTGTNKEIYQNKSNSYITGNSNGIPSSNTTNTQCAYNDTTDRGNGTGACGAGASTTGTIYGVYDMSGGGGEYVMGSFEKRSGYMATVTSGFNGYYTEYTDDDIIDLEKTDGISFPTSEYYDYYSGSNTSVITKADSIMGDATWETGKWYSDSTNVIDSEYPWFTRGWHNISGNISGVFGMGAATGDNLYYISSRTVLVPQSK